MKKLLALLLSIVMAVSLTVPAFADDSPAPEQAVPISATLDESLGIIGGADGPTAIITTFPGLEDADRDAVKKALGGMPGQVGVMVNGAYVQFPDAAPEVTGGRTMVPVRALVETLGGEVDYQDGTVRFTIDGDTYEFAVGSATVTVKPAVGSGAPADIKMDCAPYVKGGRTYVPIRFISEALGYEVGWDNDFQTAILLDREALAAKFDEKFTVLNRVQASQALSMEEGKNYRSDLKGSAAVTVFDTLDGNKTYQADITGKTLMNSEAASGTCSITISDNTVDALMELMTNAGKSEEAAKRMRTVLTGLTDMEVIMNREGLVWFHAPLVDELSGTKDAWYAMDLGKELAESAFAGTDAATMGAALAAMMGTDSVMECSAVSYMEQLMLSLYSDDKFTTSDGVSTLTIGVDELIDLYKSMGITDLDLDEVKDVFKEYSIIMKVDSEGGATVTCKTEMKAQAGVPGVKMTMDCAQSNGKVSLTMNIHIANLGEMKLTLTSTQQTTSEKPMAEPPAGANIMDMGAPELLNR